MNGRQRNAMNAQICGKKNDSNYDGNCTAHHCLSGTYEISRRWIFVRLSVPVIPKLFLSTGTANDPIATILFFALPSVSKANLYLLKYSFLNFSFSF